MQTARTVDLKQGDALLVIDIQNCFLPGEPWASPEEMRLWLP